MKAYPLYLFLLIFIGCNNNSSNEERGHSSNYQDDSDDGSNYEENEEEESEEENRFEDGTHEATVSYYNPATGYSADYTLDVEVSDGQVEQINFPNDGWLDDSHINPDELDEDGHVTIDGEDGKTYDVQIDE